MQVQTLYNFIYEFIKNFEQTVTREQLIESFQKAMNNFFATEDIKIYLMDEYSYLLKDFIKPWENFSLNNKNSEVKKYFYNFILNFLFVKKILFNHSTCN